MTKRSHEAAGAELTRERAVPRAHASKNEVPNDQAPNDQAPGGRVPLYVISRDGSPERLVALWAETDRLGVPLVRVGAAEGAPGEDGVLLRASDHRRAWERVVSDDVPLAIVLEDDVALDDRLGPLLDGTVLDDAMPPLGLVNLDGGPSGEGATRIEHTLGMPARCGAYALRRETAMALLAVQRRAEPLERTLLRHREHGAELRVALPAPVVSPERGTAPDHRPGLAGVMSRTRHALVERVRRSARPAASRPASVPPLAPAPTTALVPTPTTAD